MLCAYMDESGNTGSNINDPLQRYHYVGAVVVPEHSWSEIEKDLRAIAKEALGKASASAPGFEFHGNQLFSGNGVWRAIPERDERMWIFSECLSLLHKHRLKITYGRCDKVRLQAYSNPMHPHEVSFWLALERIASVFSKAGSLGFIVADEGARSTTQIAKQALRDYRRSGPPFGKKVDVSKVIDTIHFMNSCEPPHLQLCDLSLWVIQRFRALTLSQVDALSAPMASPH